MLHKDVFVNCGKVIKKNGNLLFLFILFLFSGQLGLKAQTTLYSNYYIHSINFYQDSIWNYAIDFNIINPALDSIYQGIIIPGVDTIEDKNTLISYTEPQNKIRVIIDLKYSKEEIELYFPYNPLIRPQKEDTILVAPFVNQYEKISYHSGEFNLLEVQRFEDNFELARPPMSQAEGGSASLKVDSSWTMPINQLMRFSPGTYYFTSDLKKPGFPLRITPAHFPKIRTLDELIDPLIYICTSEEFDKIVNSNEKKKAYDRFWVSKINSIATASYMIKEYYNRVEFANRMFSSFKEGWKTDKGMIYIIFGPPDKVYQLNDEVEEWEYVAQHGMPQLRFRFFRVSTPLAPNYYVLVRKKSYESFWYKMIELWREGQVEIDRIPQK